MELPVRSPVLVGRDGELAQARRLVDAAVAGRGSVLAVTGEAGIGKSRLLAEVAGAAGAAGCTVLTGRATPGGGAFRPLAEAVIRWLDEPAVVASAALRPFRAVLERLRDGAGRAPVRDGPDEAVVLGEALLRLLGAVAPAGGVLVLEDLHWADADTVAVVDYLAGAVGSAAVLLAVSSRPGPVATRLGSAPGVRTMALARLDRAGVAALARACRPGETLSEHDLDALAARCEGLPLLCEQLLVAPGDGEVPPTLVALVESRLGQLDARARDVVVTAAVLGPDPDWRLLGRACDLPEDDVGRGLRAAVGLALLDRAGSRLRWPHALIREAVLDSVLPPERAGLAARVAEVLPESAHAARLLAEAGYDDRAAALFLRLARAEAGRGALRAAQDLLDEAGAADEVLTERVAVLTIVGRSAEALALGESRVDAVRGDVHAELCLQLARAAIASARWSAAESYVERAGRPSDPRSDVLLADAAFGAGRTDAARLATRAVERADRDRAATALCEALGVLARTTWCTDIAASMAAFRRAAQVAAEHGLTPWRVTALAGAGMMEALDGAHPTLDRALELARDAGMLGQLAASAVIVSDVVLMTDGPAAGEVVARRAVAEAERLRLPGVASAATAQVALCRAADGDRAAAHEMAADLDAWRPGGFVLAAAVRGVVALVDHDLPAAHAELERAVDVLLSGRATPLLAPVGAWLLLSDVLDVDADGARARLLRYPAGLSSSNRAAFAYADAVRAGRAGDAPAAVAAYAEADRLIEHRPWWRRLLRTSVLECALRDGWGDPVPVLQADLAAHEAIGATAQARTCRDLLRGAGAPVRRGGAGRVPASLRAMGVTAREYDVLTLVATGLTNAEVARRLVLSPRTVDTHVANLLAKTGSDGRRDLSRWVDAGQSR